MWDVLVLNLLNHAYDKLGGGLFEGAVIICER